MEAFDYNMVQSTGLEPVTSSFAGRRSNPTELRLHIGLGHCMDFWHFASFIYYEAYHKSRAPFDPP